MSAENPAPRAALTGTEKAGVVGCLALPLLCALAALWWAWNWSGAYSERIRLEAYAQGQRDAALTILTDAGVRDSLLTGEKCQ